MFLTNCTKIAAQTAKGELLAALPRTPPHELHRKVEEEFYKHIAPHEDDNEDDNEERGQDRYPIATYHDDLIDKKRTVTVVEDLEYFVPLAQKRLQVSMSDSTPRLRAQIRQGICAGARNDEVTRPLAFPDRVEPEAHVNALAGRTLPPVSQEEGTSERDENNDENDNGKQDLPPPYPSRSSRTN